MCALAAGPLTALRAPRRRLRAFHLVGAVRGRVDVVEGWLEDLARSHKDERAAREREAQRMIRTPPQPPQRGPDRGGGFER